MLFKSLVETKINTESRLHWNDMYDDDCSTNTGLPVLHMTIS